MAYYQYSSGFGDIGLHMDNGVLIGLHLKLIRTNEVTKATREVVPFFDALDAYFAGELKNFDLPIKFMQGTDFQKKVWQQIAQIDYGKTKTYGEISAILNSHARAVGQACGRNPIPLIVPCHRVLAKAGLGGFSLGKDKEMLDIKTYLLNIEGVL